MNPIEKFQELLEEVFQFEAADLDFGIYRILNFKRDQIQKFIHEDLKKTVESAFAKQKDERLVNIAERLEEAKQKVIQTLGAGAILASGALKDEFRDTPVGREYLNIRAQKEEAETIDEIKLQVFNDIYSFFSRYYEEGDFVPQYRYSIKNHKYAIPYNGEEVKLYWANSDQYYTKTGILFRDYAFFTDAAKTFKVVFRTVAAKEELGSNKATKARFFVLHDETPCETGDDGLTLFIRFQYRELSAEEVKRYGVEGGSNTAKQEKVNGAICDTVIKGIKDVKLKGFLQFISKNDKPLLLYQLSRFSAKNSRDYFIHKNLKRFLSEQLDYFIKAEVISLETLEKERFFDKHIARAKVVREIGEKIIDFLAQIEEFQKRLWEKKKFVIRTEYVITSDMIPEESYQDILKNKAQIKEWKELGFEVIKSVKELKEKKLPVDTKHFPQDFKDRLLEKLTETADLDDLLDGLVIKSENWQGLNLLTEKYREKVKCIYIDPPYNAKSSEILYKNYYKHSSWLSLMENRIYLAKDFLRTDGVQVIAVDETEQEVLGRIVTQNFPQYEKTCISIVHNPSGQQGDNFSYTHEFAYFIYPKPGRYIGLQNRQEAADIRPLRDVSKGEHLRESAANCFYPIYVKDKKIVGFGNVCADSFHPESVNVVKGDGTLEIYPIDAKGNERKWVFARNTVESIVKELHVEFNRKRRIWDIIRTKTNMNYKTAWTHKRYSANTFGSKLLNDMFGQTVFSFPKSIFTVLDCVSAGTNSDPISVILDFFPGSGTTAHAVINLNRDDGGNRKYILIEMANYFETVLIPRIKKVVYSDDWKNGKPQNSNGISHFMKYQYLEQYEDTLDNIEVKPNSAAQNLFGDDYLLKYFLDFETRDAPSLLSIDSLKKPFTYKLKVNMEEAGEPQEMTVDIPETFNYLLGLKVCKVKVRGIATARRRKYLFILGEKEGRNIAVVWREYDDTWTKADFTDDKEFITGQLESWVPAVVYINGQSVLTPQLGAHLVEIRQIEPEFKTLMGG
ncbi:MAG: DNA methyltransferase [Proteobacteria bacterium]|nr:DNA methyltransferase [Pseudomonadota bacterium]